MKVEISSDDLLERKADDRGRITIGKEYAGKKLVIGLLEVKEKDDDKFTAEVG